MYLFYVISMLYLFNNFAKRTYGKKGKQGKAKQGEKQDPGHGARQVGGKQRLRQRGRVHSQ